MDIENVSTKVEIDRRMFRDLRRLVCSLNSEEPSGTYFEKEAGEGLFKFIDKVDGQLRELEIREVEQNPTKYDWVIEYVRTDEHYEEIERITRRVPGHEEFRYLRLKYQATERYVFIKDIYPALAKKEEQSSH